MPAKISKRERNILIGTIAVIALWLVQSYIISPFRERHNELAAQAEAAAQQLDAANRLIARMPADTRRWNQMLAQSLRSDASSTEGQMLRAVNDWARESGLNLASVKPEHKEQDKQFSTITFRATGTGTLSSVTRFLWRIQTASIPAHPTDVQITSRKEGIDDLQLSLGISTLFLTQSPATSQSQVAAASLQTTKEIR